MHTAEQHSHRYNIFRISYPINLIKHENWKSELKRDKDLKIKKNKYYTTMFHAKWKDPYDKNYCTTIDNFNRLIAWYCSKELRDLNIL